MAADPADLPWQRLHPDIRVGPMGPSFESLHAVTL
jgi:hypothetical protein